MVRMEEMDCNVKKLGQLFQVVSVCLKADLHGTTLSHATCLRQVYDTSCFV